MTTAPTGPAAPTLAPGVSPAGLLRRTLTAEWTRLVSVRATWWFLAAAAVVTVGLGTVAGLDAAHNPRAQGDPAWSAASFTAFPAQFALLGLVLLAVTSDYATGGIVPALQWTPRRTVLLLARTLVTASVATVAGTGLALAAAVAGLAASRSALVLQWGDAPGTLARVALVHAAGALFAAGLGFLLRSTAGALVGVFLLFLVLPLLLPQFGYPWLTGLADVLPGTNALFLLLGEPTGRGLTETSATVTMLVWAGAALVLGRLRLRRTDANR